MARGRVQEARFVLFRVGRQLLGAPSKSVQQALATTADLGRQRRMIDKLFEVKSWRDLIDTP